MISNQALDFGSRFRIYCRILLAYGWDLLNVWTGVLKNGGSAYGGSVVREPYLDIHFTVD